MKFTLKVGNNVHFVGNLLQCLNNAYGMSDFVIINHRMFNSSFHYEFDEKLTDYEDNKKYDLLFIEFCNGILTTKELDKFKRMLRK